MSSEYRVPMFYHRCGTLRRKSARSMRIRLDTGRVGIRRCIPICCVRSFDESSQTDSGNARHVGGDISKTDRPGSSKCNLMDVRLRIVIKHPRTDLPRRSQPTNVLKLREIGIRERKRRERNIWAGTDHFQPGVVGGRDCDVKKP